MRITAVLVQVGTTAPLTRKHRPKQHPHESRMPQEIELERRAPRSHSLMSPAHKAYRREKYHTRDQAVDDQRPLHAEVLERDAGGVGEDEAAETAPARGDPLGEGEVTVEPVREERLGGDEGLRMAS